MKDAKLEPIVKGISTQPQAELLWNSAISKLERYEEPSARRE